jgi:ATP-dependent helicase/nuclease subunit B
MRKALGLPSPERRIGAAAHDFAQAACGPDVTLIAAARRNGNPATRSRWLWRLQMLAAGAKVALADRPEVAAWSRALEARLVDPPHALKLADRPRPTPPVAVRPRELAATRVEEWIRDPYATYARYVLRLKAMDPPDAPLEGRARGTAIHAAFERFALEHPAAPWGAAETFEQMLLEALVAAGMPLAGLAREQPLARRLGVWAAQLEQDRRPGARLLIEQAGRLSFATALGEFTLTAKADRLEVREDRIDVIDFKSGGSASDKEVKAGLAPQLTLTAAIARAGGFADAPALPPGELIYARVTGRRTPGELSVRAKGEAEAQAIRALERLQHRVAAFEEEATPYLAKQQPKFISADGKGDYDHLERLWEWRVVGEGDDEAGE